MKDPKNIEEVNFVSRERIAIECRPDVWEILSKFIPNDIRKKFEDANTHSRNAFFRRWISSTVYSEYGLILHVALAPESKTPFLTVGRKRENLPEKDVLSCQNNGGALNWRQWGWKRNKILQMLSGYRYTHDERNDIVQETDLTETATGRTCWRPLMGRQLRMTPTGTRRSTTTEGQWRGGTGASWQATVWEEKPTAMSTM